jgi:hypothetical protein
MDGGVKLGGVEGLNRKIPTKKSAGPYSHLAMEGRNRAISGKIIMRAMATASRMTKGMLAL